VTLTLITDTWVAPNTKFGFNRSKQTQVIEWKLIFYFKQQCHSKLLLDISYQHTKIGVNQLKKTEVNHQKPKVDTRQPTSALQ